MPEELKDTKTIINHFFRNESGRVMSHLASKFGKQHFEIIEDAVQETFIKAMKIWPFKGVPDNPAAWIYKVANNDVYDQLRKIQTRESKSEFIQDNSSKDYSMKDVILDSQIEDDFLKMMFACCHPSISSESQIILVLKILCGFGNHEIAKALLKNEEAIAKSYTRAKGKLKIDNVKMEVPLGPHLNERLEVVLKIIYLMFNEGYNSSSVDTLINSDICFDAIRLTDELIKNPLLNKPNVHAIKAMMCFQASRFEARQDEKGNIITINKQNRDKWNQELIYIGVQHLTKSSMFGEQSEYQLQASLAACHSLARSYDETNWGNILSLYDALLLISPNTITSLNRIVALAKVKGVEQALNELEALRNELNSYYLFHAIEAHLNEEIGNNEKAKLCLEKAILLTKNAAEKNYLKNKILETTSI